MYIINVTICFHIVSVFTVSYKIQTAGYFKKKIFFFVCMFLFLWIARLHIIRNKQNTKWYTPFFKETQYQFSVYQTRNKQCKTSLKNTNKPPHKKPDIFFKTNLIFILLPVTIIKWCFCYRHLQACLVSVTVRQNVPNRTVLPLLLRCLVSTLWG